MDINLELTVSTYMELRTVLLNFENCDFTIHKIYITKCYDICLVEDYGKVVIHYTDHMGRNLVHIINSLGGN